jgi:hypothetical protein
MVRPGVGRHEEKRKEVARKLKGRIVGRKKTGENFHSLTYRKQKWR